MKKKNTSGGGIVDKSGKVLYETEDLKLRWEGYIPKIFKDNRCRVLPKIGGEVNGCEITIDKMEYAIKKCLRKNQPDRIKLRLKW